MMIICSGPLEQLHTMMGFDEGLMATILEPEACKEFFEAIICLLYTSDAADE